MGHLECSVDCSEDNAASTLDVVIEASKFVAITIKYLAGIGDPEILNPLAGFPSMQLTYLEVNVSIREDLPRRPYELIHKVIVFLSPGPRLLRA